jgi:hypothetical protein
LGSDVLRVRALAQEGTNEPRFGLSFFDVSYLLSHTRALVHPLFTVLALRPGMRRTR